MRQSSDIILNGWIFFEVKLQPKNRHNRQKSIKQDRCQTPNSLVIGKEQVGEQNSKKGEVES